MTVVMRANRAKDTAAELELRHALRRLSIRGYRVAPAGVPGRPDICFGHRKLAIFVHGCFWHQHGCTLSSKSLPKSNTDYWRAKFRANRMRDELKLELLAARGWESIVLWECDIRRNPSGCASLVASVLMHTGDQIRSQDLHTLRAGPLGDG